MAEILLRWAALLSASLFAFWALYISLVEHPARQRAGPAAGLAQFRESYRRAAPWQAGAAAVCLVAGLTAAWLTGDAWWAVGGLAVSSVLPFTLLVVMPTNRRLLHEQPTDVEAAILLARWGRLHWARTLAGIVGLLILGSRVGLR
jgi:hypothetical protein